MVFRFPIAFILICLFLQGLAQIEQPLRVEIDLENNNDDYSVIPVGEYGVVMYALSGDRVPQRTKVKWLFTGYDTEFKEYWKSGYIIDASYSIREHFYTDGFLYFLYGKYGREEMVVTELNVRTGEIRSRAGKLPKKFSLSSLDVYKNSVYINGKTKKGPVLIHMDINTGQVGEIPLKFDGNAVYESMDIDTLYEEVNMVYSVTDNRKRFINIKTFQGKQLLDDLIINPEGNDNLLTGKINTINENEKIIIGTYSIGNARGAGGLYFARLLNNSSYVIKYYNFTDFKNFFTFLSDRAVDKIYRKKEKEEAKGREFSTEHQFLVHDLIVKDGQYLMVAEAYYATYRSEAHPYTTIINGVPIMQTNYVTVFDGWAYSHAIVVGFDFEGNMLWDNSIEMGDFKSYKLAKRVSVNVHYDEVKLAYGTYDNIVTKTIRYNQVIDAKDHISIKTGFQEDVVKSSALSSVHYWYDKYFIVYGYQKIRNSGEDIKRKRSVFYFNKIAIR